MKRKTAHRRKLWFATLLVSVIVSCVHELPTPSTESNTTNNGNTGGTLSTCSADSVYFEQSVLPLVTSLCGKSGCHGVSNRHEFQLVFGSVSQSYNAIRSRFSTTTRLQNALTEMSREGVAGYVPPTATQLSTLQKWIQQGLKNNSCTGCDSTQYTFAANIQPLINTYCVACHPSPGSASTPNLSTLNAIQAELTNYPGRLLASVQWVAPYNTSTTRMPQGGAQLSDCHITQLKKWITAGAPNN